MWAAVAAASFERPCRRQVSVTEGIRSIQWSPCLDWVPRGEYAARRGQQMSWHAGMARDVVVMLDAAERSLNQGGVEVFLDPGRP